MKRSPPPLSHEVRMLIDHERQIPVLTEPVRARALARARAALVAGIGRRAVAPAPRPRWAAVAAAVCIVGAAAGAAAYQIRAHFAALASPRAAAPVETLAPRPAPAVSSARTSEASAAPAPARAPGSPTLSRADASRAELRLLRQARAAVAGEDYADALPLISEHARRFRQGRLAEEREALRVKALAGLGRTDDARRAAAAFRARFPRSVLLPAVSQMPAAGP